MWNTNPFMVRKIRICEKDASTPAMIPADLLNRVVANQYITSTVAAPSKGGTRPSAIIMLGCANLYGIRSINQPTNARR